MLPRQGRAASRRRAPGPRLADAARAGPGYRPFHLVGLFAPAGTSPEFLARAESACRRALAAPAVIAGFDRLATPVVFRSQAEFATFRAAELEKFRGVVQAAGLRPGD
ncbi:MAG: Tripartite-type tricarboxylate transporter, receptor component TctC [Rubritepida sp.]|nr:Tripartite-type tricarboxylate transporter, receptor component TctC [Rubritepida sp.]